MLDDSLAIQVAFGCLSASTTGQSGQKPIDAARLYGALRVALLTLEQQDPDLSGRAGYAVSISTANASVDALFSAASATKPDDLLG